MPQTKSTFFSLKICTYFILCFLYFLNLFFKNSLKTSTDVDMDYLKEKAKNCAKCNFYNQVWFFVLLHLSQKKHLFIDFTPRENKSLFFFCTGVKLWTRNLFPHRTFQMECSNFASLRQNEEYFHQVSHRALPLKSLGYTHTLKNFCNYFFLNRKQSLFIA